MAKKFGKFLLLGTVIGAAIAGTYYYLQKKSADTFDDDFDDFDDDVFDEDLDQDLDEQENKRTYVELDLSNPTETVEDFFDDADEDDSAELTKPVNTEDNKEA